MFEKLGNRIVYLRKESHLSQEELAEMLEVSRQSVSKWETGICQPDIENVLKMSQIFEVTVDELLKDNE